jgi:hypothetical protein
MKRDLGARLLDVIRKQRKCFVRTADGGRIITDMLLYSLLEEESYQLQKRIGAENRKLLICEGIYKKNKL